MKTLSLKTNILVFVFLLFSFTLFSADYFWVGGVGNWSELDHWATTSGGTVKHPQIPTANDNVIFDANSFTAGNQIVSVNVPTAFCRNMTWTGVANTPILRGPLSSSLVVYGSMALVPTMQFDFRGDVTFQGATTGNTITMGTQKFFKNLNFDNVAGEWIFQDAMQVDSTISLKNGILKTNDKKVDANRLSANCVTSGTLDLGNSNITLRGAYVITINTNLYTFFLDPLRTKITGTGSHIIECTSPNAWVRFSEFQSGTNVNPMTINEIRFTSPVGSPIVQNFLLATVLINDLKFSSNGKIVGNGNYTLKSLSLASGKSYEFESGKSYKIEAIQAVGTCVSSILIKSASAGAAANFQSSSTINVDYVTIQDIVATGTFNATNSIKLGVTTGWNITEKTPQTLYWVGGNGNWDDKTHWATTSGGAGGACVPTAKDDVVFDQNSFTVATQKANINVEDAFCKTMTWVNLTNGGGLSGAFTNNLHVFGSFFLVVGMDWQVNGKVLFESETLNQEIQMAGKVMNNDVYFNGDGGWILRGALNTKTAIFYQKGTWDTNSQSVDCQYFRSETKSKRVWSLGSTKFTITTPTFIFNTGIITADNMTIDPGRSEFFLGGFYSTFNMNGAGNLKFYNVTYVGSNQGFHKDREEVTLAVNKLTFTSARSFVRGTMTVDTLVVARNSDNYYGAGFNTATGSVDTRFFYKVIISPKNCDASRTIFRRDASIKNIIFVANTDSVIVQNAIIKDVLAEGKMVVSDGVGIGVTTGWTIRKATGRTLYWVGNGGDWFDKAHWSLTSGGAGGECIPTEVDDVFFNTNSFTSANQIVEMPRNNGIYMGWAMTCKNMDWTGVRFSPRFYYSNLFIHGNLKFIPSPQMSVLNSGYLTFLSDIDYTVQTETQPLFVTEFSGKGIGNLASPFVSDYFDVLKGGLNTRGNNMTLSFTFNIRNIYTDSIYVKLDSSLIRVTKVNISGTYNDCVYFYGDKINLDAGKSTFQLEAKTAGLIFSRATTSTIIYKFHNLIFTDPVGFGRTYSFYNPIQFNKISFAGDGEMWQNNITDSLIFSAGRTYKLAASPYIQTINKYWQLIGNNCESIRLQSLTSGTKATARMNSGTVLADFVQMSDQIATGTVTFFAGARSTNIANSNTGWRFENAPAYKEVGFLGADTAFCNITPIELKAFASPIASYKWSNNAITSSITVNTPGEYRCEVTFGNNCVIRDTIKLDQITIPNFDFGLDKALCKNETLNLQLPTVTGATYAWQDGKTTPQYLVTQAGSYKGEITVKGCKSIDSIKVSYIDAASFNLGNDTTLCAGQRLNYNFTITGASFQWQDNQTTPQYSITQGGLYWLEVTSNNCKTRDSIKVVYIDPGLFDIGTDKTLCDGETLTLKATLPNAVFKWQDGSTKDSFVVKQAGLYKVVASVANCNATDSVKIDYKPVPIFDLGSDTTLCDGNTYILKANAQTGTTYLWQNNTTNPNLTVSNAGIYKVAATLNGCVKSDSIVITYNPIPTLKLGTDTTICESTSYILKPVTNANIFKWQDGSVRNEITVSKAGKIVLEVALNKCSKKDSLMVDMKPIPKFDLGNDTTLCENNTYLLNPNAQTGSTYLWQNNTTNSSFLVSAKGKYKVVANLNGCLKADSIIVDYSAPPTLSLGKDTTICESTIYVLKSNSNGDAFRWQDGSTAPNYTVTKAGRYIIEAKLKGCSKLDTVDIGVTELPRFDLGKDTVLCGGQSYELKADVQNALFKWFDNSTGNAVKVSKTNTYTAEAFRLGCSFKDSIKVSFIALPQFTLGTDTLICSDEPHVINVIIPNTTISWSDNSKQTRFRISNAGIYWADVITKEGCKFRDSITVQVKTCAKFKPYVPNVFSPNGDGLNDEIKPFFQPDFQILGDYSFQIFNRWGNMVFSTTNQNEGWNASFDSNAVRNDVFVYVIRVKYKDLKGVETNATVSGDFTLVK